MQYPPPSRASDEFRLPDTAMSEGAHIGPSPRGNELEDPGETQFERVQLGPQKLEAGAQGRALTTSFGDDGAERYQRGPLLGRGGMGEVYLCRDRRLGRQVAMKVIVQARPERRDHLLRRFLREMLVQGQLEHPAVVPVYDAGRTAAGTPYFTMKCVRGDSLQAALVDAAAGAPDRPRRHTRRLLTSLSNLCLAMHYAHEKGVIHRDLKPSNVMLGQFGEVYVLDWGLSRVVGDRVNEVDTLDGSEPLLHAAGASLTQGQGTLGTPGYMAPEQVLGEVHVDRRADVYALGAILFQILTSRPLHDQPTPADRMAATLNLPQADALGTAPDAHIAPELADLCARATTRQVADRLPSALALSEAIERYLDGDRDRERRAALAEQHRQAASAALVRAAKDPNTELQQRKVALREAGHALVLAPEQGAASSLLIELLEEPPRALPMEVRATLDAERRSTLARNARMTARFHLAVTAASLPFVWWMGIANLGLVATGWLVTLTLVAFNLRLAARPQAQVPMSHVVASGAMIAASSIMFGSLVIAPMLAMAQAFVYTAGRQTHRATVAGTAWLCFALPFGLEAVGVTPTQYVFGHDAWRVLPMAFEVHPVGTPAFLFSVTTVIVFGACGLAMSMQRAREAAERRVALQGWQLRQMLPEDSKPPAAPTSASASRRPGR